MTRRSPRGGTNRFDELRRRALDGRGELDVAIRRAAFEGGAVPPAVDAYVTKVRECAYKVTDADIATIRAAGWDEEQIFELTIATALGAALRRQDRARAAMTEVC